MKKKLIFFILALMPLMAHAQIPPVLKFSMFSNPAKADPGIWKDDVDKDNNRFIYGNPRLILCSNKKPNLLVGINGYDLNKPVYLLEFIIRSIDKKLSIKKGSPCLIKLGNDSIIRLTCRNDAYDISTVGHLDAYFYTEHLLFADYTISEKDVIALSNGLKKIRFEINMSAFDFFLKVDNVSLFLNQEYNIIKEALEKKKSFEDGF